MCFEEFSGYILAGGKSSRMGTDKAFLKIGEKTFLENAVEILKPICENRIKLVINPSRKNLIEKLPENFPCVFDKFANHGALGGIHAALENCETKFAIILAVDLPFVTSEALRKLAEIASVSKEFAAIIPKQKGGKLQPLAGVYQVKKSLPKLEQILSEKADASIREYLSQILFKQVEQANISEDKNLLLNVNKKSDLDYLECKKL